MSVSIRFVATAVGAAALVFSVGCGQPPEDKPAAEGQVAKASKTPPSKTPTGSREAPTVVVMSELPANFPEDVPNHPEGRVIQARATSDLGLAVSMIVEDDVSVVSKYYAKAFADEGWSTNVKNMPDGSAVFAEKGKRTAAVMVTEGRRGAKVELIVGQR